MIYTIKKDAVVLPCLHRLIGSKRIPLANLTLVHFDSHSDLSVPLDLKADQVFNKAELYRLPFAVDKLADRLMEPDLRTVQIAPLEVNLTTPVCHTSIENWIIPLVFAGHVGSVVWMKPFWTEESLKQSNNFYVGEIRESKRLGVTSTDNYFISELSYASEDSLINSKPVSVHVVTVGGAIHCHKGPKFEADPFDNENSKDAGTLEYVPPSNHQGTSPDVQLNSNVTQDLAEVSEKDKFHACSSREPPLVLASETPPLKRLRRLIADDPTAESDYREVETSAALVKTVLDAIISAAGFVLDIDLDFFSTADPFRSTLSDRQWQLMSELYRFTPPVDLSDQSIAECVHCREEQISYLKKIMYAMQSGDLPRLSDSNERDRLVRELLDSIASCPADNSLQHNSAFDYEWLHEIGTGIDDCPLPHHISTDAEISQLVANAERILTTLPKPCAVTIARSSNDSYCPAHQVDGIQTAVLSMLERLYGKLNVDMQYTES